MDPHRADCEKKSFVPLTSGSIHDIILEEMGADCPELSDEHLDNLDNANRTRNAVQMTREMTTSNGCHVTLIFPPQSQNGIRRRIAEMFLAALEKGTDES